MRLLKIVAIVNQEEIDLTDQKEQETLIEDQKHQHNL